MNQLDLSSFSVKDIWAMRLHELFVAEWNFGNDAKNDLDPLNGVLMVRLPNYTLAGS